MDIALFREHFARIPRHVAILGVMHETGIHGVTISSLQSISVEEDRQILSFVLKKHSTFSEKMISSGQLTVNFLGSLQSELGRIYSSSNRGELTVPLQEVWETSRSGYVYIKEAPLCIRGTLIDSLEMENSLVYFVSADEILQTDKSELLLYGNRFYGSFTAIKE